MKLTQKSSKRGLTPPIHSRMVQNAVKHKEITMPAHPQSHKKSHTQHKPKEKSMAEQLAKQNDPSKSSPPPQTDGRKLAVKDIDPNSPEGKAAAAKAVAEEESKARQKPPSAQPKYDKVELKTGTPFGSSTITMRKGCEAHRIYEMLTLPLEKALTVDQMAQELKKAHPEKDLGSLTTNVRVEIAAFRGATRGGMHVGRNVQGQYNVNIKELNRGRVLTPEQQKIRDEKAAKREVIKVERLAALKAKREADKVVKAKAKEDAKKAEAAKTPEQVKAELEKMGVKAKVS